MSTNLIFDPKTGLKAPETQVIRDDIASTWVQAFDTDGQPPLDVDPTSPAGQLVTAETAEVEAKNAAMLFLQSQFNAKTAEGRWQDALLALLFLNRKVAAPSVVTCQVTGLDGTIIPYGAFARRPSDGLYVMCNASITIDNTDGQVNETTFRTTVPGPFDIAPNSITEIVTTIPGWNTINNEAAAAVGRYVESRAATENRRYQSVAVNAHGSVGAIYGALANINGVLDIQVLENRGPDPKIEYGVVVPGHGITIPIVGGEDAEIAEWIYRKVDNGCDFGGNHDVMYTAEDSYPITYTYTILRPTNINFWVYVELGNQEQVTDEIIANIKQAIFDDFYGESNVSNNQRVGVATTVYSSRFYCAVNSVNGVKNVLKISIALSQTQPDYPDGYSDVVTVNGDEEPVLSVDNITVTTNNS